MGSVSAAFVIAGLLACSVPALCIQNAVVEWQDTLEQVVRDYNISNQYSARYYALSNLAQYQVHTFPRPAWHECQVASPGNHGTERIQ